ncbi:MAG: hypothetical protein CVT48_04755 [Thermoplasmata archaeon HGW-Thermoplasmata-1]|nr:MAG: hypothetical protein CVT48_04755 [Thermoplasmata archaeon HGW-Thermoplasmata-1]
MTESNIDKAGIPTNSTASAPQRKKKKIGLSGRLAESVAKHPVRYVILFAVIFLCTIPFVSQLYIYMNVYELSPVRGHYEYSENYFEEFKEMNEELGWDNWFFILCTPNQATDVASTRAIREINAVCDRLEEYPYVESTVSLAMLVKYVDNMVPNAPGIIGGGNFPADNTLGDTQISMSMQILEEMLGEDVLYGNIMGRDHDWTLVIVIMNKGEDIEKYRAWQTELKDVGLELDKNNPYAEELTMTPLSMDLIFSTLDDVTRKEGGWWVAASVLVALASVTILFRKLRYVIIPLVVLIIVLFATLTINVMSGLHFSLISMILVAMIFGCGIDYAMHTIARYREERAIGYGVTHATSMSIKHVGSALFIMATTTTLGFFSLYFSEIRAIAWFGIMIGSGIFIAFLACVTLVPALLELSEKWGKTGRHHVEEVDHDEAERRRAVMEATLREKQKGSIIGRMTAGITKHPKIVISVFAVVMVLLVVPLVSSGIPIWGASYITAYTPEPVERGIFTEDTYAIKALRLIDSTMGIPNEIAVMAKGDMTDPDILRMIQALEQQTNLIHARIKTDSIFTVMSVYYTLNPNADMDGDGIPDGDSTQIRAAFDDAFADPAIGVLLSRVLTRDYSMSVIRLGCNPQPENSLGRDIDNYRQSFADVEAAITKVKSEYSVDAELSQTGLTVLAVEVIDAVIRGNGTATLIMLVAVFLIVFAFWRRISLSLIAMIPIVTAIIVQYAMSSILGYEITYVSLMLTGMVMGIGVDDAVHLISRFREELNAGRPIKEALVLANAEVGSVLVATTVTTVAPFIPILFSTVLWARQTAVMVMPALLGGELLVTLLVLPVILAWHAKRRPEKYILKEKLLKKARAEGESQ